MLCNVLHFRLAAGEKIMRGCVRLGAGGFAGRDEDGTGAGGAGGLGGGRSVGYYLVGLCQHLSRQITCSCLGDHGEKSAAKKSFVRTS